MKLTKVHKFVFKNFDVEYFLYFGIFKNMETNNATNALGALAQTTRLKIFRLLVNSGPAGLAAGEIANQLHLPSPTLSFHLKELKIYGLVTCTRNSRSLIYSANFQVMRELIDFLTQDCCRGHPEICDFSVPGSSLV